jgi:hypothetical protein
VCGLGLTSPDMTSAKHAEVEAALESAPGGHGADFAGKLDRATLDQAWALDVDLTEASLVKATLLATQMAAALLMAISAARA